VLRCYAVHCAALLCDVTWRWWWLWWWQLTTAEAAAAAAAAAAASATGQWLVGIDTSKLARRRK
jgi:hypothetical protein